jgi:hypothetical protein
MVKQVKSDNKKKTLSTKDNAGKKRRTLSKRFNKLKVKASDLEKKGIIYIGHLPKGFNEKELK